MRELTSFDSAILGGKRTSRWGVVDLAVEPDQLAFELLAHLAYHRFEVAQVFVGQAPVLRDENQMGVK